MIGGVVVGLVFVDESVRCHYQIHHVLPARAPNVKSVATNGEPKITMLDVEGPLRLMKVQAESECNIIDGVG